MTILGDGKPLDFTEVEFPDFPDSDLEVLESEQGDVFRLRICKDKKEYVGEVIWLRGEYLQQRDENLAKVRSQIRTLAQQGSTDKDYQLRRQMFPEDTWKYPMKPGDSSV